MAYDAATGDVVLLGGRNAGDDLPGPVGELGMLSSLLPKDDD
jgi:hypothetical protein